MSNNIGNVVCLLIGAAAGSLITWKVLKTKYEQLDQEERENDPWDDSYTEDESDNESEDELVNDVAKLAELNDEAAKIVNKYNYASVFDEKHDNVKNGEIEEEPDDEDDEEVAARPYTISPEEFEQFSDYTSMTLEYYRDKILADDTDEIITDVDEIVGWDNLEKFGEYEPDIVYVRNEERKVDYEICRNLTTYKEALEEYTHPYGM